MQSRQGSPGAADLLSPAVTSFGGEAAGQGFRAPRWVRAFEGEYRDAKRVLAALEERSIPGELTFPEQQPTGTTVLVRVHGRYSEESRALVREMGFEPPAMTWD